MNIFKSIIAFFIKNRFFVVQSQLATSVDLRKKAMKRVALFTVIASFAAFINEYRIGLPTAAFISLLFCLLYTLTFFIIKINKYAFANFYILIIGSFNVFMLDDYFGFQAGYFIFFLLIILASILTFDTSEKKQALIVYLVVTFLMVTSIFSPKGLFFCQSIAPEYLYEMSISNSVFACVVIVWLGYSIAKQNEELLQSVNNEKNILTQIFNNSVDALFLVDFDTDLVIDVNDRAVEMFEASEKSQLLNIRGVILQKKGFSDEEVQNATENINKYGKWKKEVAYKTFKNNEFWGHLGVSQFFMNGKSYNLVRVTDISTQKKYQERIKDIEEAIPGMLYQYYLTKEGKTGFNYVSAGSFAVAERSPEEFYTVPEEIINAERLPAYNSFVENVIYSAQNLTDFEWEGQVFLPSGKEKWLKATSIPKRLENGDTIWNGFLIDITERKNSENENIQLRKIAENALSVKDLFLSTMSHEIRTPLNSILGISNLLKIENNQPNLSQKLDVLQNSTNNLLQLVNNLLDINKINDGKTLLDSQEFDLHLFLDEIQTLFAELIKESGNILEINMGSNVYPYIIGDKLRLHQVVSNLVGNALKFTCKGKVTLEISQKSFEKQKQTLFFSVSDTGIGIPKDKLDIIFDTFVQADSQITRKYGGTGLGLSICQKILPLFGSKITVKSEEGKGSVFSFEITLDTFDKQKEQTVATEKTSNFLANKSILIVEDNPINTFVARNFVALWDMDASDADSGKLALEMLQKQDFDIILLDIQMPDMDGYEIATQIRKNNQKTPIIALTANTLVEVESKALKVGMNAVVTKPFQPKELKNTIENTILKHLKVSQTP